MKILSSSLLMPENLLRAAKSFSFLRVLTVGMVGAGLNDPFCGIPDTACIVIQ